MNEYYSVYTSFGGADIAAYIDGTIFPYLTDITWNEEFDFAGKIEGKIRVSLYQKSNTKGGKENPMMQWVGKSFDVALLFGAEDGSEKAYLLKGVRLLNRAKDLSVDMIVEEEMYSFEARRAIEFPEFTINLEKQIDYIATHKETTSEKEKALVDFYKEFIMNRIADRYYDVSFSKADDWEDEARKRQEALETIAKEPKSETFVFNEDAVTTEAMPWCTNITLENNINWDAVTDGNEQTKSWEHLSEEDKGFAARMLKAIENANIKA